MQKEEKKKEKDIIMVIFILHIRSNVSFTLLQKQNNDDSHIYIYYCWMMKDSFTTMNRG